MIEFQKFFMKWLKANRKKMNAGELQEDWVDMSN